MGLPKKKRHYTYADYCTWDDDERWELIDGEPCAMTAPAITHQRISRELSGQLWQFLKGKPCEMLSAPVDVLLNAAGNDDDDVFQPDIIVVCDEAKLGEKYCNGAPDMVIEIVSPSTAPHDKVRKFNKYLRAGVREYWIVDPADKTVQVYILENGKYLATNYGEADTIPAHVLEGCKIRLSDVFPLNEKRTPIENRS